MFPLKLFLPLLVTLGLTACLNPAAKEVDVPLAATPELVDVLNYRRLSGPSRDYLESRDLSHAFRKDPLGLIVTLQRELDASPTPALRQALAELCMDLAGQRQAARPEEAIGLYLAAAELAFQAKAGESMLTEAQPELLAAYNFSAGQVARLLFDAGADGATLGPGFAGPWSSYELSVQMGAIDLGAVDVLIPAGLLKLVHTDIERYRRDGFGAAMAGHRAGPAQPDASQPFVSSAGMALALNASLDFTEPSRVVLEYHDISATEDMLLGSRRVPLAADFTAPLVLLYDYVEEPGMAWKGMRHPEEYAHLSGLVHFGAFHRDRIPVVLIHGLISSPKIWLPVLNRLNADPLLREHFQLFAFLYPSGFPITYNAEVLRRELARLQAYYNPRSDDPGLGNLLLIGHSMGGVLSSMQIRDSGDTLERVLFTVPIDGLSRASAEQKDTLEALLTYDSNPHISRVVFVATPHRGSDDAEGVRGKIGAALITIDPDLLLAPPLPPEPEWTPYGHQLIAKGPNGIRSLIPFSPGLLAVVDQPVGPRVVYHSIIGQKNPDEPVAEGSDGTVAYWSSHLDGAASEKIVFAKHTPMVGDPATIEELRRILYLHAGLPYQAP